MTSVEPGSWSIDPDQEPGSTVCLLTPEQGGLVRRTVLPGGLRVITERMQGVRSAAFGIWVGVGSRDESHAQMGSAHYLEHLLFKATRRREALEISALMDAVGGDMNAFTSKEQTCYYARVLGKDLPLAIDVVGDIVTSALLRPQDVEAERGVILEEIAMRDDDPSDLAHDEFLTGLFGDTELGRSILGTQETIEAITRDAIASFYQQRYRPESIVVAAAGDLDHDEVVTLVGRAFTSAGWLGDLGVRPDSPRTGVGPGAGRGEASRPGSSGAGLTRGGEVRLDSTDAGVGCGLVAVPTRGGVRVVPRQTEQAHLVLGVPGVARHDPRRYSLGILSTILGGGMSSRLFQHIREQRGLAYSVYAFSTGYADAGTFGAYAGCLPAKADQVLELALAELADVAANGVTDEELERGKGQARASLVLGLEDSASRMSRLATGDLILGELPSLDERIARIDALTGEDIARDAAAILAAPRALTVVGPFDEDRAFAL